MTGPLCHGTGLIGSPSAAAGGAGARDGGGAEKWGKEPASAGGSSAVPVRSPRPPSKSLKGGEAEAKGGEKKRKEVASHDSSKGWQCLKCDRTFTSRPAVNGHQRVHREKQEQQAESGNKDIQKAVSGAPVVPPWPRPGGKRSKRNMGIPDNQPRQQVQQWSEMEGHGSAVAEGGPSSSSVPRNFDLNQPLVDDENEPQPE